MLVDSHCHLSYPQLGAYTEESNNVVKEAQKLHVTLLLDVVLHRNLLSQALEFSNKSQMVFTAFGNHPCDIESQEISPLTVEELTKIINSNNKIIGVGETGLDYHYSKDNNKLQKKAFETHCEVACALNKPIIVHSRDATSDVLDILTYFVKSQGLTGVIHCFSEDIHAAKKFLDINFYLSFSGITTFKNSIQLHESAKFVPLDKLLVETDSPYLAPVPYRGKTNYPGFTYYVAQYIALLRDIEFNEIARVTTNNFKCLFNLV